MPRRTQPHPKPLDLAPRRVSPAFARPASGDFSEALYEQTRNAPWVATSLGLHLVVFGVFWLMPADARPPETDAPPVLAQAPQDPFVDLKEPEPVLDPTKTPQIDATREPVDVVPLPNPMISESGREEETDVDDKLIGNPDVDPFASTWFDHANSNDATIGIGAAGPGRFGERGRGKHGDGGGNGNGDRHPQTPEVLNLALDWLRRHQSPDGRWDADGFGHRCSDRSCTGVGEPVHDAGLTGLALLCFLGDGHTHQSEKYREVVRSGLRFLRDAQDAEGCIGARISQSFQYDHSIAALALAEAYGMTQATELKRPAERAIEFIARSRNPYLAWRYGVRDGDNDTSVTGWMVMALKSAKMAGLEVDTAAFKDSIAWVDRMTDPEFGRVGYQQRGGPPARTQAMAERFPTDRTESLTAVGVLTRFFCGQNAKDEPLLAKGLELLERKTPRWDVDAGTIDMYYWYYGTLAAFQAGGDTWRKWNATLKPAVIDHQRREEGNCARGSWDPEGPWAPEGGRIYSTAIMCLTMETFERYGRLSDAPAHPDPK